MFQKGSRSRMLTLTGLVLAAIGISAGILMFLLRFDNLWRWYDIIENNLAELERYISEIPQKGLFVLAILLLFFIKCFVPIYPTSTVCFLTGVVLPVYLAVPVNLAGLCVMMTFKYFWGYRFGGGMAWKMITRFDGLRKLIEQDGKGNPWLLIGLRFVPGVPVNAVSTIYGSMKSDFFNFLVLSAAGFLPRLISFTIVGRNVFDPLSVGFLLPVMLISLLTGFTLLSVNGVVVLVTKISNYAKNKNKKGETEND